MDQCNNIFNTVNSEDLQSLSITDQQLLGQDENDIFQCGKCRQILPSVYEFLLHKKKHLNEIIVQQQPIASTPKALDFDLINEEENNWLWTTSNSEALSQMLPKDDLGILKDNNDIHDSTEVVWKNCKEFLAAFQADSPNVSGMLNECLTPQHTTPLKEISQNVVESDKPINEQIDIDQCPPSSEIIQDKQVYNCDYCLKKFTVLSEFNEHYKSHKSTRPYQCLICGRTFTQKSNQKKHLKVHLLFPKDLYSLVPIEQENNQLNYKCPFCDISFPVFHNLRSHVTIAHADMKVFKCIQPSCSHMFDTEENLLHHVHNNHPHKSYTCHVCFQTFDRLEEIAEHQLVHCNIIEAIPDKASKFRCNICSSTFSSSASLSKHVATATHKHECHICKKSYKLGRFLRRHMTLHSNPSHNCPICGKVFKLKSTLKNHMSTHDTKKFSCETCNAQFSRVDQLRRHMATHKTVGRRLQCPLNKVAGCQKVFTRRDKLKNHVVEHYKNKKSKRKNKDKKKENTVSIVVLQMSHDDKLSNNNFLEEVPQTSQINVENLVQVNKNL